jgi:hypothetical protein
MPVESKHPEYSCHIRDWEACHDVYDGLSAVRARDSGKRYLPPTTGQWIDGMNAGQKGLKHYEAYRDRATLSGFFCDAVDLFLGMLWHRPPTLELGPLEQFFGDQRPATPDGQTLFQLLRRIHVQQLKVARLGLMGDMPEGELSAPKPFIELYPAESIINWNDSAKNLSKRMLKLVVLDECGPVMLPNFEWKVEERYRVLDLGTLVDDKAAPVYSVAVVHKSGDLDPAALETPTVRGKASKEIPFVFIGSKSSTVAIDTPPFMALCEGVLALYRMDADYRQYLHMQGQETLFTKCADDGEVSSVGAGAHINIANPKGDAKFIGVSGAGLGEMRQAIENDRMLFAKKAGEMLADNSKQRESGDALTMRVGAKGASLVDIAHTSAEGLQRMLRILARWLGSDEAEVEKIRVIPNELWGSAELVTKSLLELVQAYVLNAPITLESIHDYNFKHGGTTLTWDQLIKAKRSEVELLGDLLPMPPPKPGEDKQDDKGDGA